MFVSQQIDTNEHEIIREKFTVIYGNLCFSLYNTNDRELSVNYPKILVVNKLTRMNSK